MKYLRLSVCATVCAFLFTALFMMPTIAHAQNAQVKKIKSSVSSYLQKMATNLSAQGHTLVRDGELSVTQQDGYYKAKTPNLSIDKRSGARIDIGVVAINASKGDSDKVWEMAIAWPTPILAYNKKDLLTHKVTLGKQRFSGKWHSGHKTFTAMDARYQDIRVNNHKQGVTFSAGTTALTQSMQQATKGWSGKTTLDIGDITVATNDGHEIATIGQFLTTFSYDDVAMGETNAFRNKFLNLLRTGGSQKAKKQLNQKLSQLMNGGNLKMSFRDITIRPAKDKQDKFKKIVLDKADFTYGLSNMRSGSNGGMNFAAGYQRLNLVPTPAGLEGLMPTDVRFGFDIRNLPVRKLLDFSSSLDRGSNSARLKFMTQLPKMLGKAGTMLEFKDNHIRSGKYHFTLDGRLMADPGAKMGMTADATARLSGLEGLIATLKERAGNRDSALGGRAKQAVGILSTLRMMGQANQDEPGTRIYNVKVTKRGKALLNGSNLSNMMGALGGAGQKPDKAN